MKVSIQLWIEGTLLNESVAVSTVTAARSDLNHLKNRWIDNGGKIVSESTNCLELANRDGTRYRFQIVKYFNRTTVMKPQTDHEWWSFYTNYCREKFRKNINKNFPYADAIYLAYEQTIELRTIPGDKTRFNSVNFEVLDQWAEKYDEVVDAVYNNDKKNIRCCEQCGFPMIEGFYLAGEFACCEECCLKAYDGDKEQMKEDLSLAEKIDGDCYWTEWASAIFK